MTTNREALEAWLREPLPSHPHERAMEEAARALVRGGLEGNLTWGQVEDAMTGLRYDQEAEDGDPPGPTTSEEERVAAEALAEADYRMTMELQEGHERDHAAREEGAQEVERYVEAEQEAGR
jgi:hypothetical protein